MADPVGKRGINSIGQCRQPGTREIKLDAVQSAGFYGGECLLQRRPGKGLRKNSKAHHTPPLASDTFTFSPDSADLAMATMTLIAAKPSSIPAPRWVFPWSTVSAKSSICNL